MKTYLYVPKDLNVYDYFSKANDSNISQVIHGESDIIKDYVEDYSRPFIIKIPEHRGLWMENYVFPEKEEIKILFIDEWVRTENYISLTAIIFKRDLDNYLITNEYKNFLLAYNNEYMFYEKVKIEEFGEYLIKIVANYNDKTSKILHEKELIVYRENSNEKDHDFDFGK